MDELHDTSAQGTTSMQALAELLAQKNLLARADLPATPIAVCGADCDSRVVEPGHLFVCKGAHFNARYLQAALEAGACGYVCDESLAPQLAEAAPGVPALVTNDVRSAMALVSATAWGHPNQRMRIAGITGTKGKTTVAAFVRSILDDGEPGAHAATIGTLETYDGIERFASRNTTPEAPDLWRHLAHAASCGLDMVMEVSSQGLKYQRVEGLAYDVAAFLNIGVDHVSAIEHPTFDDYLSSKLKIFEHARVALLNANLDPAHAARIEQAAGTCAQTLRFMAGETQADGRAAEFCATNLQAREGGMFFVAHTPQWSAPAHIALSGDFNVENAIAAIAIAQLMGCGQEQIVRGLASCSVPGRMDVIRGADDHVTAIVDYAHNGMSVSQVLSSVRASYPSHRIIAVFGATGGKGAERRFEMPPAAAPYADHLIFTEDDAGPEPVERICAQMAQATPEGTSHEIVLDRTQAITHALAMAHEDERPCVVCVLGKGHEARQLRADGPAPMTPDPQLVRTLLNAQPPRHTKTEGASHGV
ncbi:MAG: UDP-N-acetylmuramoyl-L-alanyl-D-glutamate--2,6-diaminopimelate ligase [Coriobacteriales bacterium]|nr:UDP-N-acetylmuramoyl-L-alanyl-D-glutamate--2,6-diaminopimelate ligase [Coriobacteriales bacterium]